MGGRGDWLHRPFDCEGRKRFSEVDHVPFRHGSIGTVLTASPRGDKVAIVLRVVREGEVFICPAEGTMIPEGQPWSAERWENAYYTADVMIKAYLEANADS